MIEKINIGCGPFDPNYCYPDAYNLDGNSVFLQGHQNPIHHNLLEPIVPKVPAQTIKFALCEQVLEHFIMCDTLKVLKNIYEIMAPQGELLIGVPDLLRLEFKPENLLDQPRHEHPTSFDYITLCMLLQKAGFRTTPKRHWDQYDAFHCDEKYIKEFPMKFKNWEALIVLAIK